MKTTMLLTMLMLAAAAPARAALGQLVNIGQIAGAPVTTGLGNSDAGTIRVVLANNSPAGTVSVTLTTVTIMSPNGNTTPIPVTGTFNVSVGSVTIFAPNGNTTAIPVSLAAVPLPSGAATTANQATGNGTLASILSALGGTLIVDGSGVTQPVSGTFYQATQPVSAAALPLPTGAATAARQDTGNSTLSTINGKITAVDTGNVTVAASALPSGAATSAKQDTGNVSLASIDTKLTAPLQVVQSTAGVNGSTVAVVNAVGTSLAVTAASLPLPTGAATAARQDTGNTALSAIQTAVQGTLTVTGPLTDAQLRASAVPVSAAALPLPSGAATAARQDTGNTSLASIDSKLTSPLTVTGTISANLQILGTQVDTGKANAGSFTQRVVLASDQPAVAVTGTFYQSVQPVSLTSLPALAAGANLIGYVGLGPQPGGALTVTSTATVVTNAGTFAVQAAQSGTYNVAAVADTKIQGGSIDTGKGNAGSVTPRVAIISDQPAITVQTTGAGGATATTSTSTVLATGTAEIGNVKNSGTFAVQATLAAETTKVIGTVNVAAAQSIAATQSGTWNTGLPPCGTVTRSSITVTGTPVTLFTADAARISWFVQADDANTATVACDWGVAAASTSTWRFTPAGSDRSAGSIERTFFSCMATSGTQVIRGQSCAP